MKKNVSVFKLLTAVSAIFLTVLMTGCTSRYVITTNLEQSVPPASTWEIGAITDKLPEDFDASKKPTIEDIESFKEELRHQLQKQDNGESADISSMTPAYEIQGGILDYKKGNGFLRFMFGFGAGAAKLIVELKVVDKKQASTVFAGNFTGQVSDGLESGKKMWETVAKDFAKAIVKERKRLQTAAN